MEDNEIISLFFERSETAITEISKKFNHYCIAIALNILPSRSDAEEIVNDTFLAVWNSIPPNQPTNLSSFLGRITRNIALDKYDYYKAKKRNAEFDLLLSELGDCISSQDNLEEQYEAGQTAKAISLFLRGLDFESRNVFLRRYWYNDSISTLAKRFYMSESKIKSMLFRTRKKLKVYLEKEGIIV